MKRLVAGIGTAALLTGGMVVAGQAGPRSSRSRSRTTVRTPTTSAWWRPQNQKKFGARYLLEGEDITTEIAFGQSVGEIEIGESFTVLVKVSASAKAKPGQAFHGSFAINSTIDPAKVDVVRYVATAKPA